MEDIINKQELKLNIEEEDSITESVEIRKQQPEEDVPRNISVEEPVDVVSSPVQADKEDRNEDDVVTEKETEVPLIEEKVDSKLEEEEKQIYMSTVVKQKSEEALDSTDIPKKKPPVYLFPITRMRLAWSSSSSIWEFLLRAVFIIFSTLGWFFCVGGVPFLSIAMLIVGSVYIDDCRIQPNIPVYLIVAGVLGTIQHVISLWTKYVPRESQGRLGIYRAYCKVTESVMQIFLSIWFVVGCVWVYGVYEKVEYKEAYKDEYCNKALYLFAFWMLNLSFIVLGILIVLSLCCILCIVTAPKDPEKAIVD